MTDEPVHPLNVFYSYAHEDEKLRNELGKHLVPLKRQDFIVDWYDRNISAGKEWEQEIDTHLNTSHIILLLISPDFLASDYCYGIELRRALERHETGEARVIPILVKPVDWQGTPFRKLQALPKNAKAVTRWSNQTQAWADVAKEIREVVKELQAQPLFPSAPADVSPKTVSTPAMTNSFSLPIAIEQDKEPETPPVWSVPSRRNPLFTGREEILKRLCLAFAGGTSAALHSPLILSGLGGIGKSQIAIEYAYRCRENYHTVLWAKADSLEVLNTDFASFADVLNLPIEHEQDQKYAIDAVKRWLEVHINWLLILDNVENVDMVLDYFPSAPRGHILMTSHISTTGGNAFRLEMEQMTPEEGILFLLHRTGHLASGDSLNRASASDYLTATKIVEEMSGLPLAIDQAGAYIERTACGLLGYLELYKERRGELLHLRGGHASGHPESVAATCALSFAKIEQANPAAAELLRFFAFLHPDAIFDELIIRGASQLGSLLQAVATDTFTLNETIGELNNYTLVRRNPEAALSIHRLIQAVLKENMSKETQYQWAERTVRAINQAFPEVKFATWQQCRRYLPHAQVCAVLIEQERMTFPEAAHLLNEVGQYLYEQGQYPEAEPLLVKAITIREQTLGLEHPETAISLNYLAELYRQQAKYDLAEPLYLRALAIRESHMGPTSFDLATSLNNLGLLYDTQAKYAQAKQLHQRALDIRKSILGPDHSDVATSLHNLAILYQAEGQYALARPLLERALAICEKVLGPEHPNTATSLNNLAGLYQAEGQYALARPLLERALAICEKVLGPEHPDTATSLNNLAIFFTNQRHYRQAEPLFERALTIYEYALGPQHPTTLKTLENYIAMLYQAKRNAKAKELKKVLKTMKGRQTYQESAS